MSREEKYTAPISHFIVEQGAGMYYQMDVDFYHSALWRELNRFLEEHNIFIDVDYPVLGDFYSDNTSNFVDNYEKYRKEYLGNE